MDVNIKVLFVEKDSLKSENSDFFFLFVNDRKVNKIVFLHP
ncbi:hypothetical protein HMPREF0669_01990 (plasmid) [Prevotella sp. oral taxon 299 str. F0039]|nr:hypothetical protein HMPREF0669_01990 [Prevotella sp. oral taxon 299 str. F0039]